MDSDPPHQEDALPKAIIAQAEAAIAGNANDDEDPLGGRRRSRADHIRSETQGVHSSSTRDEVDVDP